MHQKIDKKFSEIEDCIAKNEQSKQILKHFKKLREKINDLEGQDQSQFEQYRFDFHCLKANYLQEIGNIAEAKDEEQLAYIYKKLLSARQIAISSLPKDTQAKDTHHSTSDTARLKELKQNIATELEKIYSQGNLLFNDLRNYVEQDFAENLQAQIEQLLNLKIYSLNDCAILQDKKYELYVCLQDLAAQLQLQAQQAEKSLSFIRSLEIALNHLVNTHHAKFLVNELLSKTKVQLCDDFFHDVALTKEQLSIRYKQLSKILHPDVNKIANYTILYNEFFQLLMEQKDKLYAELNDKAMSAGYYSFHEKIGFEHYTIALDFNRARRREWHKITLLSSLELEKMPLEVLLQRRAHHAYEAYKHYRAAAKSLVGDIDYLKLASANKNMAYSLFLAGDDFKLESEIYAIACLHVLAEFGESSAEKERMIREICQFIDKIQERQTTLLDSDQNALALVTLKQLKQHSQKELGTLVLRKNFAIGNKNHFKVGASDELILKTKEKVRMFQTQGHALYGAAGIVGGLTFLSTVGYCAALGALRINPAISPLALMYTMAGGYFFFDTGVKKTKEISQTAALLSVEPEVRQRLNNMMQEALICYSEHRYIDVLMALAEPYYEERFSGYHNDKFLFKFCPEVKLEIVPATIVDKLLEHGFRPDGIAYLLNVLAEVLLSGKIKLTNKPQSDLNSLANDLLRTILENRNLIDKVDILDLQIKNSRLRQANIDEKAPWYSFVGEILRANISQSVAKIWHEIPAHFFKEAEEAPFYARYEEICNIARINLVISQLVVGAKDNFKYAQQIIGDIKVSLQKNYQYFSIAEIRLQALDDMLFAWGYPAEDEKFDLPIKSKPETEKQPAQQLAELQKQLQQAESTQAKVNAYRAMATFYVGQAEELEPEQHLSALVNWQLARDNYAEASSFKPWDTENQLGYARCTLMLNQYKKTLAYLEKYEKSLKNKAEYHYLVAVANRKLNRYSEATFAIQEALKLKPDCQASNQEAYIIRKVCAETTEQRVQSYKEKEFDYTKRPNKEPKMFNIYANDGGGYRGLFSAVMLSELEWKTNYPMAYMFDMLAGTSTGGIIAAGLSLPNPANPLIPAYRAADLLELYTTQAVKIFSAQGRSKFASQFTFGGLAESKYTAQGKQAVFSQYFGETKLSEALTELVIPAVHNKKTHGTHLFTHKDTHYQFYDALMATTAAPTYFPPYRLGNSIFVDGGVQANNPSQAAYSEALHAGIAQENIFLLSLGTGDYVPDPLNPDSHRDLLFYGKNKDQVLKIIFDGPQNNQDVHMSTMLGKNYQRWQMWFDEPIGLDDILPETTAQLIDCGRACFEEMEAADNDQRLGLLLERLTHDKWQRGSIYNRKFGFVNTSASFFAEKKTSDDLLKTFTAWEQKKTNGLLSTEEERVILLTLRQQANQFGFTLKDVDRDGNCFFHAALDQLKRLNMHIDETPQTLREKAVKHILDNQSAYKDFIDEDFESFIAKINQSGEWVDHIIILALSRAMNLNIAVIRSDHNPPNIFKREREGAFIYLGYEVGVHYQSLLRLNNHPAQQDIQNYIDRADLDTFKINEISARQSSASTIIGETATQIRHSYNNSRLFKTNSANSTEPSNENSTQKDKLKEEILIEFQAMDLECFKKPS
jgi:hypothetical protein